MSSHNVYQWPPVVGRTNADGQPVRPKGLFAPEALNLQLDSVLIEHETQIKSRCYKLNLREFRIKTLTTLKL